MPKVRVKLRTLQDPGGDWKVEFVGLDPQVSPLIKKLARKNNDGLDLEFHNITGTREDPGAPAGAPAILLEIDGAASRAAIDSPSPKKIVQDQPYTLASGKKKKFQLHQHLGLKASGGGGNLKNTRLSIEYIATPDPTGGVTVAATGGPGDPEVLIEC